MKAATTFDNGEIFQHFGQTKFFKIYEISGKKIVSSSIISSGTYSHGTLAELLKQNDVNTLICGGIGEGAMNILKSNGITVFPGISGDSESAVQNLINETLEYSDEPKCDHDHKCTCH